MKSIKINDTEKKVLNLALIDDDRVQTHYSKELFNCHYLPDIIQHIRRKLEKYFDVDDGMEVLATESHTVTKIDGTKTRIGIYRIIPSYKPKIRELLVTLKQDEAQG